MILASLQTMTVQRDNSGNGPDWFLDRIDVRSARFSAAATRGVQPRHRLDVAVQRSTRVTTRSRAARDGIVILQWRRIPDPGRRLSLLTSRGSSGTARLHTAGSSRHFSWWWRRRSDFCPRPLTLRGRSVTVREYPENSSADARLELRGQSRAQVEPYRPTGPPPGLREERNIAAPRLPQRDGHSTSGEMKESHGESRATDGRARREGDVVRRSQRALRRTPNLGLVDGDFGAATDQAVREFQQGRVWSACSS